LQLDNDSKRLTRVMFFEIPQA